MTPNLERDFAAWVDRDDPDALGRVFDATAGRLLLLASQVVPVRATAEDLVQSTFLAAMRRASTWDRSRPVWPWLAAILQNEARMEWRRHRGRREVQTEVDGVETRDPAEIVASNDQFAALLAAINTLPLRDRQVLRLRLVHGLAQVEIARTLEIPVGTVRARVHRGLAKLRVALPAGVATAVAAMLASEGALLADVRAAVVDEAVKLAGRTAVAGSGGLWIGGLSVMSSKKTVLVAAGAAFALLVGLALWLPAWGVEPTESDSGEAVRVRDSVRAEDSRVEAEPSLERTDADAGSAWELVGSVRATGGAPIPAASVEVVVAPMRGSSRSWVEVSEWEMPHTLREVIATTESDADGTFRVDLTELRTLSAELRGTSLLWVTASKPGRKSRDAIVALPRGDDRRVTAEIVLPASVALVGRILARGAPVPGARLAFCRRQSSPNSLHVGSNRDGSFQIDAMPDDDLLSGSGYLVASHPELGAGAVPVPVPEAEPSPGDVIDVGSIMLEQHATIRGTVVLGDGSVLAGFPVHAVMLDELPDAEDDQAVRRAIHAQSGRRESERFEDGRVFRESVVTRTDGSGQFAFAGLVPGAVYGIAVRDTAMRFVTVVARSGDDAVELMLDRQLITVDLRDPGGAAVPGAQLTAVGFDPSLDRYAAPVLPGLPAKAPRVASRFQHRDAGGRVLLLSPFGWDWWLCPLDEFATPMIVRHQTLRGLHRVELLFTVTSETAFGTLQLEVVDPDGAPIETFEARLTRTGTEGSRWTNNLVPPQRRGVVDRLAAGRWNVVVVAGRKLLFNDDIGVYGTHRCEVVIEDGRTTELRIEGSPGGVVAFQLSTEPAPDFWPEPKVRRSSDPAHPTVEVIRPLSLQVPGVPSPQLTSAQFVTGQPLSEGVHELLVECDGYWPVRCEVEVEVGKLLTVPIELRPR